MPVPRHGHPGELPMARRRILSRADLCGGAKEPGGCHTQPRRGIIRRQRKGRSKPQSIKMRQMQRTRAPVIGLPRRTSLRNMSERIGPAIGQISIEKAVRIRCAANADTVQHDQKGAATGALHGATLPKMSGFCAGACAPIWIAARSAASARSASSTLRAWIVAKSASGNTRSPSRQQLDTPTAGSI